jgi:N-acetylglucosaminyl-diphospho-decaprenol L-rhamnosyltransferase
VLLTVGVVNTNGGELLLACLDAVAATVPPEVAHEVIVIDNASEDGSADRAQKRHPGVEFVRLARRTGKAENDSTLLRRARGRYCLLLNEDAELLPGAAATLIDTLERRPLAAVAAASLLAPGGRPQPCAWRLPGVGAALAFALFLSRLVVQSAGDEVREVGWAQSSAMLVRRRAAQEVGYLDPAFFVYSDETDLCKRLRDAGWRVLWVPRARAVHHEQLSTDLAAARRRIVEFHRNRDLYMRKHHGPARAALVRALTAWGYAVRAVAALALPGRDPRRFALHARQALCPRRGEGLREAAEAHNARGERREATS